MRREIKHRVSLYDRLMGPTMRDGQIEVVRKFLWLPMRLGNDWRWLETANVERMWVGLVGWKYLRFL